MREIAQTNLQLYREMVDQQWPADDLARLRAAYELAAELFSGQYRCSGKPFVSHLVGTASVVAAVDGRRELVLAALLHAAYTDGDFGSGRGSTDSSARARVTAAIGRDAEALVFTYGQTRWNGAALEAAYADVDGLDASQRDQVVLRIANEADEHADFGARVCDKGGLDLYRESSVATMCDLAERLERPVLAAILRAVADEERIATVPLVLRSSGLASHLVPPPSYCLRPRLALHRALGRARGFASRARLRTTGRTR